MQFESIYSHDTDTRYMASIVRQTQHFQWGLCADKNLDVKTAKSSLFAIIFRLILLSGN